MRESIIHLLAVNFWYALSEEVRDEEEQMVDFWALRRATQRLISIYILLDIVCIRFAR